jgi:LuxR family transcriptional regulator, maltose regulon positive regulatory protein
MTEQEREAPIQLGKLHPATGTRRPLPRPRLDSCAEVLTAVFPVTLLVAPAGYGKSTLMAQWYGKLIERGVACAWLSLDEADDDKVRFMRHLNAALQRANPQFGDAAARNLDFPGGSKPLLEALAAALARVRERLVLFLDDLHFVQDPEVLGIVDWLANYAPRSVQQIIGSRQTRHLRLSALRVRGQLFELDLRQLRFDAQEASQFLRKRLGRDLPARDLERLLIRTEGWPAALELVALAMAARENPLEFIEDFTGTDCTLVDYLGEVVLSRMDERTRSLVLRISMFDRISAALAQAVGETNDAAELLQELRGGNLFLIPLDHAGAWVRFHHLVGEFFRERYLRTSPAQARECLQRGGHWLRANGHLEEAVNCMIRAQDWEHATRWVADSVEDLVFRRGYHQTILRWMRALPETLVDRFPVIRIQYAFSLSFYPRHQEYEAQIYRLQESLKSLDSQPQRDARMIDELRCAVELLIAMSTGLRDEGARGGHLAATWLASWPEASLQRKGVMGNVLAFGHKTAGEIGRGLEVIAQTRRWLQQGEGYYALAWTAYLEALLNLKQGSYLEARLACIDGLELIERELQGHPAQAGLLHAVLAAVAYEFDEIAQAIEHTELAMSPVSESGHADAVILAYLTQARLQRLRNDEHSALAILKEGQEVGERRGLRRVTLSLAAEECAHLVRAGRYEEGRLVATRFRFGEAPTRGSAADLVSDKAVRAASRYRLKESPRLVIQGLDAAIERCEQRGLAHRWVELLLLRAQAHKHDGNWANAFTDLHRALMIAAPRRYLRAFLDEGHELGALVERLDLETLRGSAAVPLARGLIESMRMREGEGHRPSAAIGQQLTKREVSILKRLESALSNKEIAEAIFVSEGTLKWHLHNVYGKLEVKNRPGAVARGRALGIL